jgi:multiple sugar transport system ATP-binding protein
LAGLALKGVSKRFGATLVLDNVSLEVGAEEFLVVLGPSGCGKSTLLRVVAGLESISGGSIEIDGRRVDHLPPGQRGVAMVFQGYALYPHMTVRANIDFGLRNAGMPRADIEERVAAVAHTLELTQMLDRLPSQLSGGQRQRVAIGRALVKEPRVFMFDEPLSNLDAALRSRMRQEIANLHRRIKTTMVFVTHDQTEAMTLADRIVVMNQRRIEQIGTPLEIYRNPATMFVAGFIGSPTINLISVKSAGNAEAGVRLLDGTLLTGVVPDMSAKMEADTLRLGVRPEAIQMCAPRQGHAQGVIDFVEYLGDRSHVLLTLASGEHVTALDGATCAFKAGQSVGVSFDLQHAHLFDAAGRSCRHRDPP